MAKHTCNQKERRNERERKRVNQVNQGFNQLRARIERVSLKKKLSKADTLREATRYIAHLKQLLNNESAPRKTYTVSHEKSSGYPSDESYQSHSPIEYKVDPNHLHQMNYYASHESR
uniref:HLH domain containing protein n=1 Tax=Pristionchus pacificus TaxID=54126 RepID=A0A8R1YX43_PRIPA